METEMENIEFDFEEEAFEQIESSDEQKEDEKVESVEIEVLEEDEDDFVPDTEPVIAAVEDELSVLSADEIKSKLLDFKNNIESNYWQMCKYLYYINKKRTYETWYPTFNDFVEKELAFQKTKARYLIQMWELLYVKQADKTVFDKVMSVGWTKAKELMHVVTRESVDVWVEKARNVSVEELKKEVKLFLNTLMPKDDEKAVLDNVPNVEGTPAAEATRTLNVTFKYHDFVTLSEALDRIKTNFPSGMSNGEAIALMCGEYLASNPIEGQDTQRFLIDSVSKYESMAEVQIVVLDNKKQEVIYGSEHLVELMALKDASSEQAEVVDGIENQG